LISAFPDGFTPLFRAAAALPALLVMPVSAVPPVALPDVVPPVEDPVVVPLVAAPPVAELPPVEPPLDCASAQVPVNASAVANPNVAIFMIAPFLAAQRANEVRQRSVPACRSQFVAVHKDFHCHTCGIAVVLLWNRQPIFRTQSQLKIVQLNLPRYQGH
jgi:hypothetical protein